MMTHPIPIADYKNWLLGNYQHTHTHTHTGTLPGIFHLCVTQTNAASF